MNYLQEVKCKAKLERKHGKSLHPNVWKAYERYWARQKQTFSGVIIGKRTLQNGIVVYDEQTHFQSDDYFTAYLVSVNMNENPVYVLPEDICNLNIN